MVLQLQDVRKFRGEQINILNCMWPEVGDATVTTGEKSEHLAAAPPVPCQDT